MEIKPLRTHPKMTKNLLDQIDTLQRTNHTSDEIASTLGITPEAVERGFDKLSERRRAEIHATKGGAFAAVAKAEKRRPLCAETACPWRSNKEYCVWPSCFKKNISTAPKYPDSDEELAEETESSVETTGVVSEPETVKPEMEDVSKATTPVATEPPADTALPEQKDDSEQLPTKGKRSSRKKQKKDDDTPVTRTNVADDGSLQKCIISGYEVFDLNNASDEIEYPNDTTQLRKETTCERIYIYNNQDEYDAAVKNREEGQAILNGEEVAPERCVILNGSIVPNLQYEVGDDGKIRISMRDLANAYSSKTIYIEENHILNVPMVYQYTAKFPTKDTPQSVLDNLNISEVVNPDDDTFTYTSTISMDLWNDTFELPQDDTYMMPIEHISRILGWEFWTGDNVLKIVSDELDDTNPDNFVIDTTVREETCYDVGTGEEIACD